MTRKTLLLLFLGGVLGLAIPAHSQACGDTQAQLKNCTGPNNCKQSVAVNVFEYSGDYRLTYFWVYCCQEAYPSYTPDGTCDEARLGADRSEVMEFALTHTVWLADCSGRYRPFARFWDASPKLIDLKPKISLSGIGE